MESVDTRWAQWQFFVIMRKNGGMKNESNSLYISTSYYDRINFDTYPWWTSISVRILMLGARTRTRWRCACARIRTSETKRAPDEWRQEKVITEIVARLRSCFVHFRMRTYVLEYESVLRRVDTFASCSLQFGWKGKTGRGKKAYIDRVIAGLCV